MALHRDTRAALGGTGTRQVRWATTRLGHPSTQAQRPPSTAARRWRTSTPRSAPGWTRWGRTTCSSCTGRATKNGAGHPATPSHRQHPGGTVHPRLRARPGQGAGLPGHRAPRLGQEWLDGAADGTITEVSRCGTAPCMARAHRRGEARRRRGARRQRRARPDHPAAAQPAHEHPARSRAGHARLDAHALRARLSRPPSLITGSVRMRPDLAGFRTEPAIVEGGWRARRARRRWRARTRREDVARHPANRRAVCQRGP